MQRDDTLSPDVNKPITVTFPQVSTGIHPITNMVLDCDKAFKLYEEFMESL